MLRLARGFSSALVLAFVLATAALVGCAAGGDGWDARSVQQTVTGVPFQPILVNSNLGVGKNRLALALFDANQEFINVADVTATFYHLDKEPTGEPKNAKQVGQATLIARTLKSVGAARLEGSAMASRLPGRVAAPDVDAHLGHDSTVFAAVVDLDRAGFWGASLDVKVGDQTFKGLRLVFAVQERTAEPRVGDPAPAIKQRVASDVQSLAEIDTSPAPNADLHRITVAQALASGKPSVVAIVTPAFCQTRFCGPALEQVVLPAHHEFGDRVNVMHIEPYDIAKAKGGKLELVPAIEDWHILAEPIIFVVGKDGLVTAKFEGIMDYAELREAILATLAR